MPSRRYAQRVRWRRLPPIEAMFRSCSEALSSSARETAGYRCTTLGVRATSLIRASAPMCSPPSDRSSTAFSGSSLMSTRCWDCEIPARIRSTSFVPPARNALAGSAPTNASASSTSAARLYVSGLMPASRSARLAPSLAVEHHDEIHQSDHRHHREQPPHKGPAGCEGDPRGPRAEHEPEGGQHRTERQGARGGPRPADACGGIVVVLQAPLVLLAAPFLLRFHRRK